MISFLRNSLLIFLYFLYTFHISFRPLPHVLRTRLIFGIIGLGFILFYQIKNKKIVINKHIVTIIIPILLVVFTSVISMVINLSGDSWYLGYSIQMLIFLSAAFFIIYTSQILLKGQLDVILIAKFIVLSTLLHHLLALIMFFNPTLNEFITNIQNYDPLSVDKIESNVSFESRLIGVGVGMFFFGGVITGGVLLINAFLIKNSRKFKDKLIYWIIFIILTGLGILIARTTIIGAVLGLILIIWPQSFRFSISIRKSIFITKNIFWVPIVLIAICFGYYYCSSKLEIPNNLTSQGFEMFINYSEGKGLSTRSTDALKEMYIFPTHIKTWLLGDAKFSVKGGMGFYMGTDVGYLRTLFYSGVLGLLSYWSVQFFLVLKLRNLTTNLTLRRMFLLILVYTLILNFKGLADVNFLLFLFFAYFILSKENQEKVIS